MSTYQQCPHCRALWEPDLADSRRCGRCGQIGFPIETKKRIHASMRSPKTGKWYGISVPTSAKQQAETPAAHESEVEELPRKGLNGLAAIVLLLVIAVHLHLLGSYGTLDACKAATQRAVNIEYAKGKKPETNAEALGQAIGRRVGEGLVYSLLEIKIRSEHTTLGCYGVAMGLLAP